MRQIYHSILDDDDVIVAGLERNLPLSPTSITNRKFPLSEEFIICHVPHHEKSKTDEWTIKQKGCTKLALSGRWNAERTCFEKINVLGYTLMRDYGKEREIQNHTGKKSKKIFYKSWGYKAELRTEGDLIDYFTKHKIIV